MIYNTWWMQGSQSWIHFEWEESALMKIVERLCWLKGDYSHSLCLTHRHTHATRMVKHYAGNVMGFACCPFRVTDWPAEAGVVKEGVRAAGSADKTRDPQQPKLRLQTAYWGAQRVSHCQGATCCHPANRGNEKPLACLYTYSKSTSQYTALQTFLSS